MDSGSSEESVSEEDEEKDDGGLHVQVDPFGKRGVLRKKRKNTPRKGKSEKNRNSGSGSRSGNGRMNGKCNKKLAEEIRAQCLSSKETLPNA